FLRACARFRQQTGLDPSQQIQEQALIDHPEIARLLLDLKTVRLDPAFGGDMSARLAQARVIEAEIVAELEKVESLDADRVLRRLMRLILSILRTNFYQTDPDGWFKPAIAIKIASDSLEELPEPKPYREIYVWSPRVEGVHIRFGPVARGGLRWSDRQDDFRTEVLGLVKAQFVKNAVIVPVGAKGGFYPKQLPKPSDRAAWLEEGTAAYKLFVSSLLDVTDNIVEDRIVHPHKAVIWDREDPYLVVAADKGTAAFSDLANEISEARGFWLGDAFASGGSAGYDHKKMGITARGAWEAVKRHFREVGKDIQSEDFTVIGVGDMSGDVFGNGMLLSKHIRLLAAFDHRDIFIDPNPADPEKCWTERKRLFDMERSTWADYDESLISKGGGVFPRNKKSITLTPEIKALTGLAEDAVAPSELIRALLKTECELLWFGGIGAYIKASGESDAQVGDKFNDSVRILADEAGAAVIGEGANLGVTQAGRVELARRGVRLNADFIDNAAGVGSSDYEVNIKILLNPVLKAGRLSREARDELLVSMTDDVAGHVLTSCYDQTLAISMAERSSVEDLDANERLIERLEARGVLNRRVEGLPTSDQFRELREAGLGLTRPELSILVSYAKISLFDRIVDSPVPDDPHFDRLLEAYFPGELARYGEQMRGHRLRREIVATVLANDFVNLGGATFSHRAREATGGSTADVARAFEAARRIFGFSDLIKRINALDNAAPAEVQHDLYAAVIMLLRRQTFWLVRRGLGEGEGRVSPLRETIEAYKPGVAELRKIALDLISPFERERVAARAQRFIDGGAPETLAHDVARLQPLTSSTDVIGLAAKTGAPITPAARIYHAVGEAFRFDELRAVGGEVSSSLHWDRLAVRRMIEDLYADQQKIAGLVLATAPSVADEEAWARDTLEGWIDARRDEVARLTEQLDEFAGGDWTLSKLALSATALRDFVGRA
ncbi:MAG: NAD-glutamate dehydrogenase, partial [Maricaulaceae bacterium]